MSPNDLTSDAARECLQEAESSMRKAAIDHASSIAVERAVRQACTLFDQEYKHSLRAQEALQRQLDEARAQLRDATTPDLLRRVNDAILALCDHFDIAAAGTKADALERVLAAATTKTEVDQPESIPVAELAEVLGCDADATSVRTRLEGMTSEEDGPQPDADGWYKHDGRSWPACRGDDLIVYMDEYRQVYESPRRAQSLSWFGSRFWWRYTDGRDTGGGDS